MYVDKETDMKRKIVQALTITSATFQSWPH